MIGIARRGSWCGCRVASGKGWVVYQYLGTFVTFYLNRLNKAVLLINTENQIIEISNNNQYYSDTCFGILESNEMTKR